MGYIQYASERIRKSYEKVFERNDDFIPDKPKLPETELDIEYYKKLAFKRYLDGEIDRDTLNALLKSFEKSINKSKIHDKIKDVAYC
ncbi:MAG: hypothetical protein DRN29_10915 [Thermoplasmata archaeon]|nr:MAG: hypothetical protein DRN29_10915 [Thermoplasmata archaeon]